MIKISGSRLPVRMLERHSYVCDLLYSEGPLISLFRDRRFNWIYLWLDTDQAGTDRWLLFPVSRADLVGYLSKSQSLRALLTAAGRRWLLDTKMRLQDTEVESESSGRQSNRILRDISDQEIPGEYSPAQDSFFDESLTPDISLAREVSPVNFKVPINGNWFFSDLDRFSGLYGQLYAFFYCTKPQFVTNLSQRVRKFLRSPWEGGFSRINLFRALQDFVPSLHDLEIKSFQYASPGQIQIEALPSVAARIVDSLSRFVKHESIVSEAEKAINSFLSSAKLKKRNVSTLTDDQIGLTGENISFLSSKIIAICEVLGLTDEMSEIIAQSPNIIVTSKVLVALVQRIRRLAEFQSNGQIDLI